LERGLGSQHPASARARVHTGAARWSNGDAETGERLMRDGVDALDAQFPSGHADLASAKAVLGEMLVTSSAEGGRRAAGRVLLQTALAWRERHLGPDDWRTGSVRDALRAASVAQAFGPAARPRKRP